MCQSREREPLLDHFSDSAQWTMRILEDLKPFVLDSLLVMQTIRDGPLPIMLMQQWRMLGAKVLVEEFFRIHRNINCIFIFWWTFKAIKTVWEINSQARLGIHSMFTLLNVSYNLYYFHLHLTTILLMWFPQYLRTHHIIILLKLFPQYLRKRTTIILLMWFSQYFRTHHISDVIFTIFHNTSYYHTFDII